MAQADASIRFDTKIDNSKLNESLSGMGGAVKKGFGQVTKIIAGVSTALSALGGVAIKQGIDFESAFAGVRKTVDATERQFSILKKGIIDMSKELPTSAANIAEVAEVAGQLGIKQEDVLGFTRVMIDMGESTDLSSEAAASAIARFANITGMAIGDADRLGSTIVGLGNNFATTETEIMDMTMRIAGMGAQIGLTESQMLAWATAMSSVGINAEAGGSAFSKLGNNIAIAVATGNKDLKKFASVAGQSSKDFKVAFETNANNAILSFIGGLKEIEISGGSVIATLDEMNITETRMVDTVLRLVGGYDEINRAMEVGNKSWQENKALSEEAEERYKTLESQISMVKNQITAIGINIGEHLMPIIANVIGGISNLTETLSGLSDGTKKAITISGTVVAVAGSTLLITNQLIKATKALTLARAKDGAETLYLYGLEAKSLALKGLSAAQTKLQILLIGMQTGAINANTIAVAAAEKAQWLWNAAKSASPIGLLVAGAAALTAGTVKLVKWINRETEAQKKLREETEELSEAKNELLDSVEENESAYKNTDREMKSQVETSKNLTKQIKELTEIENKSSVEKERLALLTRQLDESMEGLNLQYDRETDSLLINGEAVEDTNKLLEEKVELRASEIEYNADIERLNEILREQALIEQQIYEINEKKTDIYDDLQNNIISQRDYNKALEELEEQEEELIKVNEELGLSYEDLERKTTESSAATQESIERLAEAEQSAADMQEEIVEKRMQLEDELTEKMIESANEQGLTLEEYKDKLKETEDALIHYSDVMLDTYNKLDNESKESLSNINENIKHNQATMSEWGDNLGIVADRVGKENKQIVSWLADLGEQGIPLVHSFVEATDEELDEFVELFNKNPLEAQKAYETQMEFSQKEMSNVTSDTISSVAKIIEDDTSVNESAMFLVEDAKNVTTKEVTVNDFASIGRDMVNGIVAGVNANQHVLNRTMTQLVNSAINAAKRAADIRSPSKRFEDEIGKPIAQGVAVGIDKEKSKAAKAAEEMAKLTFDNAKTWIEQYRLETDYLISEEVKMWEILQGKYEKNTKERIEIDKGYLDARDKMHSEELSLIREHLQKQKDLKEMNNIDTYATWYALQGQYAEGTKARIEIEKELASLEKDIAKEKLDLQKQIIDKEKEYENAVDSRAKAIFNTFGLFDELKEKEKVAKETLTENLKAQVDEMSSWANNMQELSERGIEDGLLKELQDMGPKANEEIKALLSMSDYQLEEYSDLWAEKTRIAKEQSVYELRDMRKSTRVEIKGLQEDINSLDLSPYKSKEQAEEIGVAIIEALSENIKAEATEQEVGDGILQAIDEKIKIDINELKKPAIQVIERFIRGMLDSFGKFKPFARALYSEISIRVAELSWNNIGESIINGMVAGLYDRRWYFDQAIRDIMSQAQESADSYANAAGYTLASGVSMPIAATGRMAPMSAMTSNTSQTFNDSRRNFNQEVTITSDGKISLSEQLRQTEIMGRRLAKYGY